MIQKRTNKKDININKNIESSQIVDIKQIKKTKITKNNTKAKIGKKQSNEKFIPRLLCFSNIDIAQIHPYYFIENILNQSYIDLYHIFNIFIDSRGEEIKYKKILKPFFNPTKIKLNFFLKSNTEIDNHLIGFVGFERQNYNMFLYINPNNIYLPDYIDSIINQYNHKSDVCNIKIQEKNNSYNYILNNKSLDILIKNKSNTTNGSWFTLIEDHKLKITDMISDNVIIGSPNALITEPNKISINHKDDYYKVIENEFFTICMFEHNFWSSFVYLNKRNNRMYNIYNDDHGAFLIKDDNTIVINWDTWGEETFYKKCIDNSYYYSVHK